MTEPRKRKLAPEELDAIVAEFDECTPPCFLRRLYRGETKPTYTLMNRWEAEWTLALIPLVEPDVERAAIEMI